MIRREAESHWDAMLSFLQTAGQRGFPEYALEVNMALADRLPRGSQEYRHVMEEVARLTRVIEAGKVSQNP